MVAAPQPFHRERCGIVSQQPIDLCNMPWFIVFLLYASPLLADPLLQPSLERQRELVHLVRQDCGSCHGMTLQGGLGPSLTPATLQGKSVDSLVATIYRGRPGTPMPPWHRFLSESEARWIVEQLQAGFPE